MVIFSTLGSFTEFFLISLAILSLIYIYDAPIRRFEDRMIERIHKHFFSSKQSTEFKQVKSDSEKNYNGEKIA